MKQKRNNAPTMKDVAREAGVALGTVSKVINGKPVGEEYVRRVNEAIERLDYHVNSYAQGLKSSRTYTIAVILPNTSLPFFGGLAYHINKALLKRHYRMLLCCSDYDTQLEQEYIRMAQQNKVDGIIGLTYNPGLTVDPDTPFVSIDRTLGPDIPCVASDNYAGGQLAAEKLADLGCRRVAYLREGSSLSNEPNKRKAGFENGCDIRGLNCDVKCIDDGVSREEFRTFLREHLHGKKFDYDGIFCVTDRLALFVREILADMGLRVPEDVQLIGFDGMQMFGEWGVCCSTIVQPVEDIAELCVDLLVRDAAQVKPQLMCLPVTYRAGGTTREEFDRATC